MHEQDNPIQLIGRHNEYQALWSEYESATGGRTRVVLVSGEPGIGKTHLLGTVARDAEQQGTLVLRGGASEAEGMPPYLPFLEALGRYIQATSSEELREQIGPLGSILTSIFPELALKVDDLPSSYTLPPEQSRLRLFEAVGAFIAAIAAERPLVLMLDDLQWADSASLDLLCAVVRYQPAIKLLVLGAMRSGQMEHGQALSRAIRELNRQRVLRMIELSPITASETASLATSFLGAPLNQAGCELLFSQSEGNPFFAEELLRGWIDGQALSKPNDESAFQLDASSAETTPVSILGAVQERLDRLGPAILDTLRSAAIIGREFDVELLASASGETRDVIGERLLPAERANLIQRTPHQRYSFSHDKIRECLYLDLSPVRRQRLHGFIGHALETRHSQPSALILAELAYHFTRSGDRARGAEYAERAGTQALESYAAEEATEHFSTAVDLLDPADSRRGGVLLRLGEAASLTGDEPRAVEALSQAYNQFIQSDDTGQAARASLLLGRAYWRQEAISQARSAFEEAHRLLAPERGPELVEVLVDLASLLAVSEHRLDEGIALAREALHLAELLEEDRLLAAANRTLGNLLVRENDLASGTSLLESALDLAIREEDLFEAVECCGALAPAYFWQGEFERSREVTLRRLEFAQRTRDPYQMRHVYPWLAIVSGIQGRLHEARELLERAEIEIRPLASPEPRAYLHFCHAGLNYYLGDYAGARQRLFEAVEIYQQIGPNALVWYKGFIAMIEIVNGNLESARQSLEEFEPLLDSMPDGSMPTSEPLAYMTEAALSLGDRNRLERYYQKLKRFAGQYHDFCIDRQLGQIETLRGDFARADEHLRRAEEAMTRHNIVWEIARVLEAQADLELARNGRGGIEAARQKLQRASRARDPEINPTEHNRLMRRLEQLNSRALTEPSRPGGLSPREIDVIRLVAAGMSNREIAEDLFISEKTVINHLTHIFNKLGVDNRAAAAAFAVRHDLA